MPFLIFGALRATWALRRDPQFVSLALLATVALVSGTGFYSVVEGLRFIDALYFSVITLTTVGCAVVTTTSASSGMTVRYRPSQAPPKNDR